MDSCRHPETATPQVRMLERMQEGPYVVYDAGERWWTTRFLIATPTLEPLPCTCPRTFRHASVLNKKCPKLLFHDPAQRFAEIR